MQWYEILLIIAVYIISSYLTILYKDYCKNRYNNDSWKNRKK